MYFCVNDTGLPPSTWWWLWPLLGTPGIITPTGGGREKMKEYIYFKERGGEGEREREREREMKI